VLAVNARQHVPDVQRSAVLEHLRLDLAGALQFDLAVLAAKRAFLAYKRSTSSRQCSNVGRAR
jgi:hypothetical protein